jgi:hypothetical protein
VEAKDLVMGEKATVLKNVGPRYNVEVADFTKGNTTRRKLCHMQPAKERLRVIYNSYTTQQLKNCINPKVHQGAVVFQLYNRLGDVVVERGNQQTLYIIPAMK